MAKTEKDARLIEYKDTISQLNMTIKSQNEIILSRKETIASNQEQMRIMTEKIDYLSNKLFGTSSEKTQNPEGQYSLFDEAGQEAIPADESGIAESVPVKEYTRKAKSKQSDIFKGVPSRDGIIPLSEDQKHCTDCGAEMKVIGREFVRREFRFTPAKGEVVNIYVETAKCPVCSEAPAMAKAIQFVKSHVPEALIPHSYATASVAAWVMYQKYANSMLLYRQEQDWKQLGVMLNRATLADCIIYCATQYFKPFYDYLHRELLKREFLMADETRIQVLHEEEWKAETDSFMWLFRSDEDGMPAIVLYKYTETRAKFNAVEFLNGFQGYLETDCYQGYNNLHGIKRCCCFAHMRRYFAEAVPKGKELDYSDLAAQGVQYINRLFEHERYLAAKNHTPEQRHACRLEKEKPILEALWKWISQQDLKKGTRFEKVVDYARNHKDEFMTYLEDGRCSFSNNLSENAIRPFTVGRRNWLFSDTPKGADASSMVYTMVEMAKTHGLNIYKYLNFLLEQLPGTVMTDEGLSKLVPWNETVQANCSGAV